MKNLLDNPLLKKIASHPLLKKALAKFESNQKMAIAIIAISAIMLLYLDFAFIMSKQLNGLKSIGPKVATLRKDLKTIGEDLLKMREERNKQPEAEEGAFSKKKKIITEEQKSTLLEDVSGLANKNGVKIAQIKFSSGEGGPKGGRGARGANAEKQEEPSSSGENLPLLITIEFVSDYHQLGKFINDLENAQFFFAIENLDIKSQPNDYLKHAVNLVFKTYVRK